MRHIRTLHTFLLLGISSLLIMFIIRVPHAHAQELTRQQAWRDATTANLDMLIAKADRDAQSTSPRIAFRPYVPFLSFQTTYRDEPSLVMANARNQQLNYSAGLRWNSTVGTQMNLTTGSSEFFSGASFVPQPSTNIAFSITQALWQGGWSDGNQLTQRSLDDDIQTHIFVERLNAFLVQVDQAYWNLAIAQADVAIKQRSRDRAKTQFEDTRENIRRDILAPSEIHIVEENLVFFEQQLIVSQEQLSLTRSRLSRLMRKDPKTPWITSDRIEAFSPQELNAKQTLAFSLQTNPQIQAQKLRAAQAEHQIDFITNQSSPRLDLSLGIGLNGLDDQRFDAWAEALTAKNPEFRIGLVFEIPLHQDPNNARLEQAHALHRRNTLALEQARDNVRYSVNDLLTQLRQRSKLLELSIKRIKLSEQKLETEVEKYKRGLSTLPNVVLFQRDLDSARINERRARVDVIMLYSRLASIQGVLHKQGAMEVK